MIRTINNSFVSGVLDPALHGRHDLKAYFNGFAESSNFIVRRTGGLRKRPGTDQLVVLSNATGQRIIPFIYDRNNCVLVIMAANIAYFIEPSVSLNYKQAAGGGIYMLEHNINIDPALLNFYQAGDTLFLTAAGRTPRRLVRSPDGTWACLAEQVVIPPSSAITLAAVSEGAWAPEAIPKSIRYAVYEQIDNGLRSRRDTLKINVGNPWPAGGVVRLSFAAPAGSAGRRYLFAKMHAGSYGVIGNVESDGTNPITFDDDNIQPSEMIYDQTNIRDNDASGYALMGIYQQRTVLAGCPAAPFTLWFSRLADLYTWYTDRPADDMSPFSATMPAIRGSRIRHMISGRRLIILTEDGVYAVHSEAEGFSSRTAKIEKVNNTSCGDAVPHEGDNSILFVADDNRRLIEIKYDFAQDGFVTLDRSVLANHLTEKSPVKKLAWQGSPEGILWCLLADGTLLAFTYLPEHDVYAWTPHALRNPFADAPVTVTDIIAPGSFRDGDGIIETTGDIYLTASYTVPGANAPTLALLRMRPPAITETSPQSACLDYAGTVAVPANYSIPVALRAGAVYKQTSSPTWTTLAAAATITLTTGTWIYGMPVAAHFETLRPELPDRNVQGLRKTITDTLLRVRRTLGLAVRRPGETRAAPCPETVPGPVLFTGDLKVQPFGKWDRDARLRVEADGPYPAEILELVQTINAEAP